MMKKISFFLKILVICLCVCIGLFLSITHSSGQFSYYPYGNQQSYYGSGMGLGPDGGSDYVGPSGPLPNPYYPFPYSVFGRQQSYNPYGSYQQSYNPYGSYQQSYNPYGSYQQPYNPYGYQQSYNPYGYQQSYNPYGSYQQAYNPYGSYQQPYNPYSYEQPFISANYPPIGSRYPPWLQQSYYPYGYPLDDLPSGSILGFAPLGYGIPDGFNYGPINTGYGLYNGWTRE